MSSGRVPVTILEGDDFSTHADLGGGHICGILYDDANIAEASGIAFEAEYDNNEIYFPVYFIDDASGMPKRVIVPVSPGSIIGFNVDLYNVLQNIGHLRIRTYFGGALKSMSQDTQLTLLVKGK